MKKILIRTVCTDVFIFAIAFAKKLEVEELWVAFGIGKHLRHLPIHKIAGSPTTEQCKGPPIFHAFTGYDTAWKCYPEVTEIFHALSLPQTILSEQQFRVLETMHGSPSFLKVPEA